MEGLWDALFINIRMCWDEGHHYEVESQGWLSPVSAGDGRTCCNRSGLPDENEVIRSQIEAGGGT